MVYYVQALHIGLTMPHLAEEKPESCNLISVAGTSWDKYAIKDIFAVWISVNPSNLGPN